METGSQRDICTLMFVEALFETANTWKQAKCPSTIKMWYTYTYTYIHTYIHIMEYLLFSHEKEANPAIYDNMNET